MRIKCPHCNGKGFSEINSTINMTCGWCMGQGELDLEIVPTEPQTEQEYLQTCTTEQLAEWICSVHEKCYYCGAKRVSDREHCPFGDGKCRNNKHEIAMWLKQPHTEKE